MNANIVLAQDGMNRLVNIVLPSDYDPTRSYPLVIGFHGAMNMEKVSIEPQETFTNLGGSDVQDWVDEFQFIAASPAGFNNADGNPGFIMGWNSFPGHRISKADDVRFTIDLIAFIEDTACIDTSRVFATGHSSGAIFTYKLATSTDRFRAIAPTAGLLVHNRIELAPDQHPISILEVHGSEDIPVPYSGGGGVPTEQFYSVAETMSAFSNLNGCEPYAKSMPSEEEFLQ